MTRRIDAVGRAELARRLGRGLLRVRSPLQAGVADSESPGCTAALASLRNPYVIEDEPGAWHTTGWLGAFESTHSEYAVAAETPADIAAAVQFARDHDVRLAIKGTGHDYLGRSSAPGSLLIWTKPMRDITVHDAFTPKGAPGDAERALAAVTVGAGARWLEVYHALAGRGRFALGGGCTRSEQRAGSPRAVGSGASHGDTGPLPATSWRSRS